MVNYGSMRVKKPSRPTASRTYNYTGSMKTLWRMGAIAGAGLAGAAILSRSGRRLLRHPRRDPIHELARALTHCDGMPDIFAMINRCFMGALQFPAAIFIPEGDRLCVPHHNPRFKPEGIDFVKAAESISSGALVTHNLSRQRTSSYFVPLSTCRGTLGTFGFRVSATEARISPEKWALIESFVNQTSLAILRVSLEDKARDTEILAEADRLHQTLLNSLAHNVRTPLSSIIGVLSTLQEQEIAIDQQIAHDLIDTARMEAERLNRLLGNLLDLSRLEAGALHIRKHLCDVQDVIGAALEQLGSAAGDRPVDVVLPPDLPFVPMDFVLIVQVLVNLLDNALKYSPPGPPITIEARVHSRTLDVSVSDLGNGVAEDDLVHIFEKFNRGGRSSETGGIGLGLSICRGLIEAHHGSIWAERRCPQGTRVTFSLPIQQQGY